MKHEIFYRIFLYLLIWSVSPCVGSQNLCLITGYDERDGLSQGHVTQMIQDREGMMWFASWNGLNRFDGYEFVCFKSTSTHGGHLPSDRIRRFWLNDEGNFWCMVDDDLFLFNSHDQTFTAVLDSVEQAMGTQLSVSNVYMPVAGTTYVACKGGCLLQIDSRTLRSHWLIDPKEGEAKEIEQVTIDPNGLLWVLTSTRTFCFDGDSLSLPDKFIALRELEGAWWGFTADGRIGRWDERCRRFEYAPEWQALNGTKILSLSRLREHRLLVCTMRGAFVFDGRTLAATACVVPCLYAIEDSRQGIWGYDTEQRVFRMEIDRKDKSSSGVEIASADAERPLTIEWMDYIFKHKSGCRPILFEDQDSTMWLLTPDGRLYYYDLATAQMCAPEIINHQNAYGEQPAEVLLNTQNHLLDRQKNLWTIEKHGVYKTEFKTRKATVIPQEKKAQVRSLFVDSHRRTWVTTGEDATVRVYAPDHELLGYVGRDGGLHRQYTSFGAAIYCMTEDREGRYWLGSKPQGLFVLEAQSSDPFEAGRTRFAVRNYRSDPGNGQSLNNDNIYDIKQDAEGKMWIATLGGGLNCVVAPDRYPLSFIHAQNGFSHYPPKVCKRVRQLYITSDGVLLAATTEGLLTCPTHFDHSESQPFYVNSKVEDRVNSLSNNATMSICEDRKHRLYIGTESGGLNRIVSDCLLTDTITFRHYTIENGLPSDIVYAVFEADDRIWFTSSNALLCLNPDNDELTIYNSHFWKELYHYTDATPQRMNDREWVFGTMEGLICADLSHLKKSTDVPPISFTNVYMANTNEPLCIHGDTLTLQPDQRNITIGFAALDYSDVSQISYAFQLQGSSDDWNDIRRMHAATFLDLAPKTYRFSVRSTNSDGVWVDNIRTLVIVVVPTFGETPWAKVLYGLLALLTLAAGGYLYYYIFTIKKQKKEILDAYLALLADHGKAEENLSVDAKPAANVVAQQSVALSALDEAFMQKVMNFVEANLDNCNLSIDDLAAATAVSHSGLNRRLKSIVGVTPVDFIKEARIQKAAQLIRQDEMSVTDIAYQCGFSDPKYFSRCFKKATGFTPSDYKLQLKN